MSHLEVNGISLKDEILVRQASRVPKWENAFLFPRGPRGAFWKLWIASTTSPLLFCTAPTPLLHSLLLATHSSRHHLIAWRLIVRTVSPPLSFLWTHGSLLIITQVSGIASAAALEKKHVALFHTLISWVVSFLRKLVPSLCHWCYHHDIC